MLSAAEAGGHKKRICICQAEPGIIFSIFRFAGIWLKDQRGSGCDWHRESIWHGASAAWEIWKCIPFDPAYSVCGKTQGAGHVLGGGDGAHGGNQGKVCDA